MVNGKLPLWTLIGGGSGVH